MAQRGAEMAGGLAMGAERRRPLGGERREAQHGCAVGRLVGVMDQAGDRHLALAAAQQRGQRAGMEVLALGRRQAVLDRATGDFVAEAQRAVGQHDHARVQAFLQHLAARRDHVLDQPAFGLARNGGHQVRGAARRYRQPRQAGDHRIADRRRNLALRGGKHFGHEEGIAARHLVQAGRRAAGGGGQALDRAGAERRKLDAPHRGRRQVADDRAQRMLVVHLVVAIADGQHHAQPVQPAAEELEKIERGVVGPVRILDDQHRGHGMAGAAVEHQLEDLVPVGGLRDRAREVAADLAGDVLQRRQRMGREQSFAAAPQHARLLVVCRRELPKQGCLADPGLAGHQGNAPARSAHETLERCLETLDA